MIYSIWMEGWSDTFHEIKNPCSESPNRFQFILFSKIFTRHVLTLIWLQGTELENFVTVVVNCYDVVPPTIDCCKSKLSEYCCVEKCVRI